MSDDLAPSTPTMNIRVDGFSLDEDFPDDLPYDIWDHDDDMNLGILE